MGLLDDAIREHLELKRLRGADPDELARQEDEALGDPRNAEVAVGTRRSSPEFAEPPAEEPLDVPEFAAAPADEPAPPVEEEPPSRPRRSSRSPRPRRRRRPPRATTPPGWRTSPSSPPPRSRRPRSSRSPRPSRPTRSRTPTCSRRRRTSSRRRRSTTGSGSSRSRRATSTSTTDAGRLTEAGAVRLHLRPRRAERVLQSRRTPRNGGGRPARLASPRPHAGPRRRGPDLPRWARAVPAPLSGGDPLHTALREISLAG